MKPIYLLLAVTILSNVDAAPERTFEAKGNKFFEGGLDDVQGALEDIESAGEVLDSLEEQLKDLDANSGKIIAAEIAIEAGIAKSDIKNAWKRTDSETSSESRHIRTRII